MAKIINRVAGLAQTIKALDRKANNLKQSMEENFISLADNLKPANLIKSGAHAAFNNKGKLIGTGIGLLTGFASRRLLVGSGASVLGKTAGKLLQWGITFLVYKNANKVREKLQ